MVEPGPVALIDGTCPVTFVDVIVPAVDSSHASGFQLSNDFVLNLHVLTKPGWHFAGIGDVAVEFRPFVHKVSKGVVLELCVPLLPARQSSLILFGRSCKFYFSVSKTVVVDENNM